MDVDVMCIGISCADVLIQGVDFLKPFESETKSAEAITVNVGGDAANQAIILSRMGMKVKLMTGLGKDEIGSMAQKIFENNGVDMTDSVFNEQNPSAINVVLIDSDGQRNFINSGVPKSVFFEPNTDVVQGAKIVSLGSIGMPPFMWADSIEKVVKKAREEGAIVCADVMFNPNSCSLEEMKEALNEIDYIFPNEEEAKLLTGKNDLDEMADVFLNFGVKTVLIKIGKDGVFLKNKEIRKKFPAIGKKVLDTTGAGDNFAAGFITGLIEKKPLEECVGLASAFAGVAIQYIGANTGVRSREQVENHLKNNS